jgi:EAL domain-containing protein (putative c-di-GMP-specific phosphodiesterase class I)
LHRQPEAISIMSMSEDIRAALDRGELFLEYLPTVMLADSQCIGAEALVRWRRGDVVLPAAAFIPLIENTPVSGTLTYWVLDTVARQLGRWLSANADAHISINVPPEILGRGGLAYVATRSGLSARVDQIVLEITERGVPDRLGLEALNLMAARGVRLALDDVMMSGANLALLTRCKFSMIKLDREIIGQLLPGRPVPAWFDGLASLLRSSPVQVVAEGVQSEYQVKALNSIGVQMAQGHFYSTTLPAPALINFHREASVWRGSVH